MSTKLSERVRIKYIKIMYAQKLKRCINSTDIIKNIINSKKSYGSS